MASYPLDYIFAGATILYQANVESVPKYSSPVADEWYRKYFYLKNIVYSHYGVNAEAGNHLAGSVMFNLKIHGDMRSINDVKATMDGAVKTAGFTLLASFARFLSNPRRDGTTQPPVNTPGVPPPVTQLPPAAGNVDTPKGDPSSSILGTALDAYLGPLAKSLGVSSLTLALIAIGGIVLLTRR
jgi:hypothetical protein